MFADHLPHDHVQSSSGPASNADPIAPGPIETERGSFPGGCVVQLAAGDPDAPDVEVTRLHSATVTLTNTRVSAAMGQAEWSWLLGDLEDVYHGGDRPWTILAVPGVDDHGVAVGAGDVARFRRQLDSLLPVSTRVHHRPAAAGGAAAPPSHDFGTAFRPDAPGEPSSWSVPAIPSEPNGAAAHETLVDLQPVGQPVEPAEQTTAVHPGGTDGDTTRPERIGDGVGPVWSQPEPRLGPSAASATFAVPALALAGLEARGISAWFGTHLVLDLCRSRCRPAR